MKTIEELRRADEHTRKRLKLSLDVARELKINPNVKSVYLAGSAARGQANPFSDTDVVIEVPRQDDVLDITRSAGNIADKYTPFYRKFPQNWHDRSGLFDTFVYTEEKFKNPDRNIHGSYITSLKRDAILLYKAPSPVRFVDSIKKLLSIKFR